MKFAKTDPISQNPYTDASEVEGPEQFEPKCVGTLVRLDQVLEEWRERNPVKRQIIHARDSIDMAING